TETCSTKFRLHFLYGHRVFWPDRNAWVLLPIFEQDQPTLGPQCASKAIKHFPWLGKFVINIHQKLQINVARGKFGVGWSPQYRLTLVILNLACFCFSNASISGWMSSA